MHPAPHHTAVPLGSTTSGHKRLELAARVQRGQAHKSAGCCEQPPHRCVSQYAGSQGSAVAASTCCESASVSVPHHFACDMRTPTIARQVTEQVHPPYTTLRHTPCSTTRRPQEGCKSKVHAQHARGTRQTHDPVGLCHRPLPQNRRLANITELAQTSPEPNTDAGSHTVHIGLTQHAVSGIHELRDKMCKQRIACQACSRRIEKSVIQGVGS
jgi:hypothetical protein